MAITQPPCRKKYSQFLKWPISPRGSAVDTALICNRLDYMPMICTVFIGPYPIAHPNVCRGNVLITHRLQNLTTSLICFLPKAIVLTKAYQRPSISLGEKERNKSNFSQKICLYSETPNDGKCSIFLCNFFQKLIASQLKTPVTVSDLNALGFSLQY